MTNPMPKDPFDPIAEQLVAGEIDRPKAIAERRGQQFTQAEAEFFADAAEEMA